MILAQSGAINEGLKILLTGFFGVGLLKKGLPEFFGSLLAIERRLSLNHAWEPILLFHRLLPVGRISGLKDAGFSPILILNL